jgi:hypothetical protein
MYLVVEQIRKLLNAWLFTKKGLVFNVLLSWMTRTWLLPFNLLICILELFLTLNFTFFSFFRKQRGARSPPEFFIPQNRTLSEGFTRASTRARGELRRGRWGKGAKHLGTNLHYRHYGTKTWGAAQWRASVERGRPRGWRARRPEKQWLGRRAARRQTPSCSETSRLSKTSLETCPLQLLKSLSIKN